MSNPVIEKEILKRRTFAIISHPDAGKTTTTEKLLLYGGAIQMAGTVKAKRGKKFATSDWMELEKARGISISSTAMTWQYQGAFGCVGCVCVVGVVCFCFLLLGGCVVCVFLLFCCLLSLLMVGVSCVP